MTTTQDLKWRKIENAYHMGIGDTGYAVLLFHGNVIDLKYSGSVEELPVVFTYSTGDGTVESTEDANTRNMAELLNAVPQIRTASGFRTDRDKAICSILLDAVESQKSF